MDYSAIIEGTVKFRDGKKWKSRWCVMRKISPVADCLHLQLYRDSKDRYKQGQTKASLSLQHFLGVETGFTLDKESNTIAILCQDVTVVLAFDTRERLIQWQVKIANNLGEDQQYLIQVGSAPPRTKIPVGPARLHIQEYRFSLTTGVPPRLIGVWNISQLRRYGVVDHRFCFEGGSGCGRWEGLYVFVTDEGEEITKSLNAASQGKLISKRKPVSRNMSVMDSSPKKRLQSKYLGGENGAQSEHMKVGDTSTLWDSTEINQCEFGDTVSVSDLTEAQECEAWMPEVNFSRCTSCISKVGGLPRSMTMANAPGTGFNPAWIMEGTVNCCHRANSVCCKNSLHLSAATEALIGNVSCCRSSVASSCGSVHCHQVPPLPQPLAQKRPKEVKERMPDPPSQFENYDVPRKLCLKLNEKMESVEENPSGEYYDTPKKIKENLKPACSCDVATTQPAAPCSPTQHCSKRLSCGCANLVQACQCFPQPVLHCQTQCQAKPVIVCHCPQNDQVMTMNKVSINGVLYAQVDVLQKMARRKEAAAEAAKGDSHKDHHYANMEFAQSLPHYENVKDIRVSKEANVCFRCNCPQAIEEDYLLMGPVPTSPKKTQVPPYLPMHPAVKSSPMKCLHVCCHPENKSMSNNSLDNQESPAPALPSLDQSRSATASPFMRRHDPNSYYACSDKRRIAQIRRRSNSMDSGRCGESLECITERTVSSSAQNTLTANSASASVDSLPSEKTESKSQTSEEKPKPLQEILRRPSSVPCKGNNRDSSSSNDSGFSTGSLKHFSAGFLEFETVLTPLSRVRRSNSSRELVLRTPRRSKSSDPLQNLSFHFGTADATKSSSAEAEVPICTNKKDISKDLSVSSSSGALTIPYMDSISTSSGASDMSDYIETLSLSSYSSSEAHENLRLCHSAVTVLRPRSGKEYQKIDRSHIDEATAKIHKLSSQHADSPSPGYMSSTSSN